MYLRKRTMINEVLSLSEISIKCHNHSTEYDWSCLSYDKLSVSHDGIPGPIPGVDMDSHIVFSKKPKIMGAVLKQRAR